MPISSLEFHSRGLLEEVRVVPRSVFVINSKGNVNHRTAKKERIKKRIKKMFFSLQSLHAFHSKIVELIYKLTFIIFNYK